MNATKLIWVVDRTINMAGLTCFSHWFLGSQGSTNYDNFKTISRKIGESDSQRGQLQMKIGMFIRHALSRS